MLETLGEWMNSLLLTMILTFALLMLAMAGLGIGWILRGKPLERGCGKKPGQLPSEPCDGDTSGCEICNPLGAKPKEKERTTDD